MAMAQLFSKEKPKERILSSSTTLNPITGEYSTLLKDLISESKGKVTGTTRTQIATSGGLADNEVFATHVVAGQKLDWKLYQRVYNNVGMVKNAINNTANFAIQSGYELESEKGDSDIKKVKEWIDKHNFDLHMINVLKQGLIFGNAYMEFGNEDDFKHLPVEQMYVIVKTGADQDGEIAGYAQKSDVNITEPIRWEPDEIIHFKWNELGTSFYGMPDIRAALTSIKYLLQYEEDVGEIIHRYGHPIVHWVVGTEDSPGTSTHLGSLKTQLDGRKVGEDLITTYGVEGKPISSDMKLIQLDGLLKILQNEVIGALEVPSFFIRGGESSNRSTSQDQLKAFDRRVKAVRATMGQLIEDRIFKEILGTDVKFAWRELSTEGEKDKSEIVNNLVSARVPTTVALQMVGWGTYVDEVEEKQDELPPLIPPMQPGQNPMDKEKPKDKPKTPKERPKEEDFSSQAAWIDELDRYKKGLKG